MQKQHTSEAGILNPRLLTAFALCSVGLLLAMFSFATPAPATGTISRANPTVSYTDATGAPPNLTGVALGKPNCGPADAACSVFTLTVDPSISTSTTGYDASRYQLLFQWQWAVATVDYDIYVEDTAGNLVAKNNSTADPSSIIISADKTLPAYKIVVVLATGGPIPYTGTITLQPAPPVSGLCDPSISNCAPPRYQNYPAGVGQANGAGEPSIGVDFNPNVAGLQHDKVNTGGVAFFTANRTFWRVNFDDCSSPAINLWEDVSALTTQEFVLTDPIGFVDHYTTAELGVGYPPPTTPGRAFSLDLIGGQGDSFGSYTDDDGGTYLPGGNGGPGQGPDHETLGGGPYSANQTLPISHPSYPNAIYYCSQNIVAEAQCSRSDDGGQTFGPGIPIFSPSQCTGGIHGHVKVARDGTVYVPNSSCGTTGTAGVAVSTDNGLTWTENNVTDSTSNQDPSVGIGQNDVGKPAGQATNTIYLGYVDGDGHAKVVHSGDKGANYSTPVDVGAAFGVTHAVFPVVVTGDDNRAAFAFVGTGDGISTNSSPCNPYGAVLNCANNWHLYIATTYDGGANWITIDATPNDPVQQGTVCLEGTTCLGGRNLLDFNDFAIDSQGRGLVGWADGCVNCDNTFSGQSSAAHGTVTRQSGGRRLFAFFDPNPAEPAVPAAPQLLSATAQAGGGILVSWLEPDNGGSVITAYNIYRGDTSGGETLLATVTGDNLKYLDTAAITAGNAFYYVTAVNAVGEGTHCRELALNGVQPNESACTAPYITAAGPGSPGNVPTDPTSGELTIERVGVGEPFVNCTDRSITFVMKVQTLQPAPPPNAEWQVIFQVPDTTGAMQTIFVEAETQSNPSTVSFSYGYRTVSATGGSQDTGESAAKVTGSTTPDGTIVMHLDVSGPLVFNDLTGAHLFDVSIAPGSKLAKIGGNTYLLVGAEPGGTGGGLIETVSTTGATGSYTSKGNISCQGLIPTAQLTASPLSGAPPLAVHFDASASSEPQGACGVINSYTLDFGDGTPPVTQATPTFDHTYVNAGDFPANLTVSDTVGATSTNPAQVVITVATNSPPTAALAASPTTGDKPLDVTFDATGSSDPDFGDTLASYTFRFGDGSADVTTGNPIVTHTYTDAGSFAARLVVTDSKGNKSENTAQQVITVSDPSAPTPTPSSTPTPTPGGTATPTPTPGGTATPTPTPGGTATPTPTPGGTATPTPTPGGTATPTPTPGDIATPTPTPGGTATPTPTPGGTATPTPTPMPQPTPANLQLLNISGRVLTQSGDNVGIGGFIVKGPSTKRIMARALGPSLQVNGTPVAGRIPDPILELHDSNGNVLSNDNWKESSNPAEIASTGLAPTDDKESAIVKRLPPGNYTAIIRSADGTPGVGLVEIYDLSSTTDASQLGNLSVRALVETDDDVLIDGVLLRGGNPKPVVFRAIGPELHDRGVEGELQDPILELHDGNGNLLGTNDNWKDAPNSADIQSSGLAPTDDRESAILMTLPNGDYTTIVRGVGDTTGIALSEVFKLD